ncbi:uncharacterized protein FRV6_00004 [Fusarium oxysporum]|uniref:GPI anchored protein n=1 Tax=Fusarium oxysporum TaxID=5507 RepID=A0A2H3SH56_FUSOX|nr:uncharacterized protein FRV6_00004 [Fusarium oxysporum]
MRISSVKALLPVLLGPLVAASELHISVDDSLDGPIAIRTAVEYVVDKLPGQSRLKKPKNALSHERDAHIEKRELFETPRDVLDGLLVKRQCYPGYGYCSDFGNCCPEGNNCCEGNCSPVGTACCRDGRYCEAGNSCFLVDGRIGCCTDAHCTAYVSNGITSYASTRTITNTYSYTSTRYYYWSITYSYWYYYWTYYDAIEASVVTSSLASTTTVLSVFTTDVDAASEYFSSVTETIVFYTPAAATSLESLAGRTSVVAVAAPTDSESPLPTSTEPTSIVNGGPSYSAARTLWSSMDGFITAFMAISVGIGIVAAML